MGIKIKKRYPNYFEEFNCIGGKCEDSCCIGWDIDIDKATFKQYHKVKDSEMKKMFQKNLQNNNEYSSVDVDYGKVKLKDGKRCPFLDECNYCIIYTKLGEEYLSNVCTCFPRITNRIDGYYEMSLDVACPEAARILLLKENGIEYREKEEILNKYILSSDVDTKSKEFKTSPVKYFNEIRDISIKIIKNRRLNLDERLFILGEFINGVEDELQCNFNNVSNFIKNYDINVIRDSYESNPMNYIIQIDFFKKMIEFLNVNKEVDSVLFKQITEQIVEAFNLNDENSLCKNSEIYIKEFNEYIDKYLNDNSYIFENYLVNFMYSNLFPFNESQSMFDGYIMLITRYSFIRFYLVGKYIKTKCDSKEEIVKLIQIFSKTIEHHKSYLVRSLRHIKENEFDNIEFAKTLL